MSSKTGETSKFQFIRKSLFPQNRVQGKPTLLLSERKAKFHGIAELPPTSTRPMKKVVVQEQERDTKRTFSKPSLGFLRPTLSSLAKSRSQMKNKSSHGISSVFSPELQACEVLRDVCEREQVPSVEVKHFEKELVKGEIEGKITTELTTHESLPTLATTTETEEQKFSMSSNSFIIWEAHDDESLDLSRIVLDDDNTSEGKSLHDHTQKENIIPTPKFPCTKSTEKKTKRKLCFRSGSKRLNRPDTRIQSSSPPPDFDVTINSAPVSPDCVRPPLSYDIFRTPILNLSSVVSSEDTEKEETVYYTPCGELN